MIFDKRKYYHDRYQNDPELRKRMIENVKRYNHSKKGRLKIKAYHQRPEVKARMKAYMKDRYHKLYPNARYNKTAKEDN